VKENALILMEMTMDGGSIVLVRIMEEDALVPSPPSVNDVDGDALVLVMSVEEDTTMEENALVRSMEDVMIVSPSPNVVSTKSLCSICGRRRGV
jgi:hypothetical protein